MWRCLETLNLIQWGWPVVGFKEIAIIDGGEGTVREIKRRLKENNLLSDRKEKGIISIYNSLEDQKIIDLSLKLIEKK